MTAVDLNADVGEECADDAALFALVTSANVAAGGHAGGGYVLQETVRLAALHDVAIGAHPSYPDPAGFGRSSRWLDHGRAGVAAFVSEQVVAVVDACHDRGVTLSHVKAHGALYADAGRDPEVAEAMLDGIVAALTARGSLPVAVMGLAGTRLERACRERGIDFLPEVFADRAYSPDGSLRPRSEPGAVLHDPDVVAGRAVQMVTEGRVLAADGSIVELVGATVCLHGDTPGAVGLARRVRQALEAAGVRIARHDRREQGQPGPGDVE